MLPESFKSRRDSLFNKLQRRGALEAELEEEIADVYGARGRRAVEAIKRRRVIRRGRRWFVRGRTDEYEVVKSFCTCRDYVMNISTGKAGVDMCYHALAKNVCQALNSYYLVEPET
jgi:predicted nucleic acid-binding Zn finger protein